jgi:hypothetical protein
MKSQYGSRATRSQSYQNQQTNKLFHSYLPLQLGFGRSQVLDRVFLPSFAQQLQSLQEDQRPSTCQPGQYFTFLILSFARGTFAIN